MHARTPVPLRKPFNSTSAMSSVSLYSLRPSVCSGIMTGTSNSTLPVRGASCICNSRRCLSRSANPLTFLAWKAHERQCASHVGVTDVSDERGVAYALVRRDYTFEGISEEGMTTLHPFSQMTMCLLPEIVREWQAAWCLQRRVREIGHDEESVRGDARGALSCHCYYASLLSVIL